MYCNIIATMLQFYIIYVLKFASEETKTPMEVALIPLLLYITSTAVSSRADKLFLLLGRRKTFSIGGFLMVIAAFGLLLIDEHSRGFIYPLAILIGAAQALVLNTGLALISEVIGGRGSSGAFVFGCYSFLDKVSTGIALFIITNLSIFKKS